jgi:hypothetical protein
MSRLSTIIRQEKARKRKMKNDRSSTISPVTPGELLNEEFILPMGITKYRLSKEIGVPPQ